MTVNRPIPLRGNYCIHPVIVLSCCEERHERWTVASLGSSSWNGKENFPIQSRLEKEVMSMTPFEILVIVFTVIGLLMSRDR